ncbi:DEKNAAC102850 [Brettanomyces naardenensis]|uniref:DEKNAAC102850 n=1 Tax=Brettanomyces naardenensis TaxID=13370 RepID=A0A448YLR8_BRENA|nr:DEKNAAC102850 [Brettanomyces naardenensis]
MHFSIISTVVILLAAAVNADVGITSPADGSTVQASSGTVSVDLQWKDDGVAPDLNEATAFTFKLCTGPNSNIQGIDVVKTVSAGSISGDKYTAKFDASQYASGLYYVQIYTTFSTGGYTIHYSPRFSVTGLTGSTAASGSGDPPAAQESIPGAAVDSKSFTIPYTAQTGITRYAPMQMQPGSTITVTTWSRIFPTSAVTYYTTMKPSPDVSSTITPGWSYSMESLINQATPAAFPSEVGWYPASQRLESATLERSLRKIKKRRWDD